MKRISVTLSIVLLTLFVTMDVSAQRRGGMRNMMRMMSGGGMQLDSAILGMAEVQKELKLTDDQKEKIVSKASELNDELRTERREIMMDGGDLSELEDFIKELKEEEKEIIDLLDDDQKERLSQLRYQRMGNYIYQNEDVQESLEFSDEQKENITQAFKDNEDEMSEAMEEAQESRDFSGVRETMQELQNKLSESLAGALNEKQSEKLAEMKGDEFEFPQRRRGGRRGNRSDF